MKNKKIEEKTFYCVEDILEEYTPERLISERAKSISDPYEYGVLLAKTDMKEMKKIIQGNG